MASEVLFAIRGSVSRRILLSNEINLYREWAYLIEEENSNLSSTRVRFGTFLDLYINDIAFGLHAEWKMHLISGTMAALAMYRETTRISKFASS